MAEKNEAGPPPGCRLGKAAGSGKIRGRRGPQCFHNNVDPRDTALTAERNLRALAPPPRLPLASRDALEFQLYSVASESALENRFVRNARVISRELSRALDTDFTSALAFLASLS
jgi:hypothetical protein